MLAKQILRLSSTAAITLAFILVATSIASARFAGRAPTAPTNLTVSSVTETTAGLSWGASVSRQGIASYKIRAINHDNPQYNTLLTVSGTQTSHTARFLAPGSSYTFSVFAVDERGNRSPDSNAVNVETQADTTPPSAPNLTAVVLSPSQVQLTWTQSTDNLPLNCCTYKFAINDVPYTGHVNWMGWDAATATASFRHLTPGTAYSFKVDAIDFYQNRSTSNAVTVVTEPSSDVTPPTPPSDLRLVRDHGCPELDIGWTQSTDDTDPQQFIEYEIFVNGVQSPLQVATGVGVVFVYAASSGESVFTIRAVDRSGNTSAFSKELRLNLC